MFKLLKDLPRGQLSLAIGFLLLQAGCDLYLPTLMSIIVNQGIIPNERHMIIQTGLLMLVVAAVSFSGALLNTYLSAKIAYDFGGHTRQKMYEKTRRFGLAELDHFGISALITRNTNDVTQVQSLVEMGLKFIILAPIYFLGGMFLAFRLDARLASYFVYALPLVLLGSLLIVKFANPLFEQMQRKIEALNRLFRESLLGIRVTQAFNREADDLAKYETENQHYTTLAITSNIAVSLFPSFLTLLISLVTLVITWQGAQAIASSHMQIGTLMAIVAYASQILMGIGILAQIASFIPRGQVAGKRINEVLDYHVSIDDDGRVEQLEKQNALTTPVLAVKHLSFKYLGAERDVLTDISFDLMPGETLAVIGSTGAGKTTLVELLNRFYEPTHGTIDLMGTPLAEFKQQALHQAIALVPQENQLFSGTLKENMCIARPTATDEDIWHALELAEAKSFIAPHTLGLDLPVEKNGDNFSGGQKQRLCLARAFLKDSPLLIFDDSFSALDFKTDWRIRQNMARQCQSTSKIVIAQRIGTVQQADKILVLAEGQSVGFGTHQHLLATNTTYQEIYASQMTNQQEVLPL